MSAGGSARHLVVPLLVALPLFFWGIGALPLRDPDEGLYASIAREMLSRGDWLTPRFNGLPYLEKPPLYYWLTALTYGLFGFSEWGARLWAAVGSLGTVLLTALLGREAFGARVGLVASLLCATSLGVFLYGRFVGVDLLFTLFLTSTFLCFLRWIHKGGWPPLLGLYLSLALMILTKGVLGLLFPLLPIGRVLWLTRRRLRDAGLWWGVPLLLAVVLPWHLLVSRANPGFLSYYLLDTHLVRFLQGTGAIEDETPLSTLGFLLVSLVWFIPWSLFLPSALVALWRKWRFLLRPERVAWNMVLVWAATIFGVFSASAFKLEHYALPAFPALALLVASLWSDRQPGWLVGAPLAAGAAGAMALCAVAFAFRGAITPDALGDRLATFNVYFRMLLEEGSPLPLPPLETLWRLFQAMSAALLFGFGAALLAFWYGAVRGALNSLLVGTMGFLFAVWMVMAAIAPFQSVKGVAQTIRRLAAPEDVVLYEGYLENAAALPYYAGRQIHLLGPARGDLAFGSRFPEASGLFHGPEALPRLWQGPGRVFLVTDQPVRRSAVQSVSPERTHLLILDLGKRLYSNQPG